MSVTLKRSAYSQADSKGRLVSIFIGAVLLPSVALSVVSFHTIPRQAEATRITLLKHAERVLWYIEDDLEKRAQTRAKEAARQLGAERLLDGRREVVEAALAKAGMENVFETIRLEGSSPLQATPAKAMEADAMVREALGVEPGSEESLTLSEADSGLTGTLHFRYTCKFAHQTLIRDYFDHDFVNPDQAMVVRVTEPGGELLYENAPSEGRIFEVQRTMESASFHGIKLFFRYRERSIRDEVHRWAVAKAVLVGFIDLMLGAGLFLVYKNVHREMHLSKLKSDFVANVSHELKTPLALIRLFSETLELGRVSSSEKAQEYYRIINKESQRLTQLINNILDFSRIEAGKKEYRFAPTDLARVVQDIVEAYRFPIEQLGFELEVRIADDLPEVVVDKEAIGRALINLLNNAIKYSASDKHIRLELARQEDSLVLSVRDRGIGIAKAEQKKIFEKFYRAEDSLVHETKGSGLGLALVRHIMEGHGGEVRLESAPGKGSTFSLVIPISRPEGPTGSAEG